jgi:hypothetical protein
LIRIAVEYMAVEDPCPPVPQPYQPIFMDLINLTETIVQDNIVGDWGQGRLPWARISDDWSEQWTDWTRPNGQSSLLNFVEIEVLAFASESTKTVFRNDVSHLVS